MNSRKVILPNYIEFAKNRKRIGRLSWSRKPYNGNIYFEPCFQLVAKMNRDISKTSRKSIQVKKSGKVSAVRNTAIHDAENVGLVPVLEP